MLYFWTLLAIVIVAAALFSGEWGPAWLRTLVLAVLVTVMLAALAMVLAIPPAQAVEPPLPPRPDVLLVQHAYDGPLEQAARVSAWRYVPIGTEGAAAMHLDWVDTTTDGIYRGGFEARADVRDTGEGG